MFEDLHHVGWGNGETSMVSMADNEVPAGHFTHSSK